MNAETCFAHRTRDVVKQGLEAGSAIPYYSALPFRLVAHITLLTIVGWIADDDREPLRLLQLRRHFTFNRDGITHGLETQLRWLVVKSIRKQNCRFSVVHALVSKLK